MQPHRRQATRGGRCGGGCSGAPRARGLVQGSLAWQPEPAHCRGVSPEINEVGSPLGRGSGTKHLSPCERGRGLPGARPCGGRRPPRRQSAPQTCPRVGPAVRCPDTPAGTASGRWHPPPAFSTDAVVTAGWWARVLVRTGPRLGVP